MTIVLTGVTVARGDRVALTGVDLTIEPGEFVSVVGPNGSGKTTLLQSMAGDLVPTEGSVHIDGRSIGDMKPAEAARVRAFLGQDRASGVGFDVASVVGFGAFISDGISEPRDRVAAAMARTAITELAHRRHDQLSGGEQRRVAIARVLCQDAPVVLLDEPTDTLDLGHAGAVMNIAREEAADGKTVVASSHDLNIAARFADRMVLLSRGRIVAVGSPEEVLTAERLSEVYQTDVMVVAHPTAGTPLVVGVA